jgi:hypothetical protein
MLSVKELYTFRMIQKTTVAYSDLHTHARKFVSNDLVDCCCCAPLLEDTSFENGYSTTEEVGCSAFSQGVCNSCVMCISHTTSHGTIEPSTPGTRNSSLLCVQTSSEAHPTFYPMGTGGPFPGVKRGRGVTLTTHPRRVPRSRKSKSYGSCPLGAWMA